MWVIRCHFGMNETLQRGMKGLNMTRKDYEVIAGAFKAVAVTRGAADNISAAELNGMRMAAFSVAKALSADNPRFDYERFIRACGFNWN